MCFFLHFFAPKVKWIVQIVLISENVIKFNTTKLVWHCAQCVQILRVVVCDVYKSNLVDH